MKRVFSILLVTILSFSFIIPTLAVNDEAANAADTLHSLGLFGGTGTDANGNPIYDLERAPTRSEAVTMLVGLLGKKEEALNGNWDIPFTDVADWAKPFVGYAYSNGLTSGTSATTFGGNDFVSASQYLTFVLKVLGYETGKDFQWDKAWELSDKIGLTDGRYNADTKMFTRGDVAIISCNALPVNQKGTVVSLQQKLEEEKQGGHRAWFYVDDLGELSIQTNIDARDWDSYSIVILNHYIDGGWGFDTQGGGHSPTVEYNVTSLFSHKRAGTVLKNTQLYVLRGIATNMEFWQLYEKMGDHEKALAELGEKYFTCIELDTRIRVEEQDADFQLTNFTITYDDAQQETYTASITGEIKPEGEYGLFYNGKSGGQFAGMSYIGRGEGVLTHTRDRDHFALPGASGSFSISYCTHSINGKNEIVCLKSESNSLDHEFK